MRRVAAVGDSPCAGPNSRTQTICSREAGVSDAVTTGHPARLHALTRALWNSSLTFRGAPCPAGR